MSLPHSFSLDTCFFHFFSFSHNTTQPSFFLFPLHFSFPTPNHGPQGRIWTHRDHFFSVTIRRWPWCNNTCIVSPSPPLLLRSTQPLRFASFLLSQATQDAMLRNPTPHSRHPSEICHHFQWLLFCFILQPHQHRLHFPTQVHCMSLSLSLCVFWLLSSFFRFSFCLLLKSLQKKRNGLGQEPVAKVGVGGQRQTKKTKAENPTSTGHAKVRKIVDRGLFACRFLLCLQFELKLFSVTDTRPVVF